MRLLVVEDEARLALLLKHGPKEQGYVVHMTGDCAEALWLATETGYDTIVLDVMLPAWTSATRRLPGQAVQPRETRRQGPGAGPARPGGAAVLEVGSCGWTRRAGGRGAASRR